MAVRQCHVPGRSLCAGCASSAQRVALRGAEVDGREPEGQWGGGPASATRGGESGPACLMEEEDVEV